METQPLPVAAATNPTPATVESETPCRFCRVEVPLTETGMLYRRDGKIFAVACIPCAHKRDRA